ncbi:MAG: hypothetical protein IJC06_04115 [Clostridia bacterium]|nr:hypothetical protein [Clostridia bacterium]
MAQTSLVQRDYYDVDEVTALIGMSKSFCYKLVQTLNKELKEKGCIVFPGKVPKKYLQERLYCGQDLISTGGESGAV